MTTRGPDDPNQPPAGWPPAPQAAAPQAAWQAPPSTGWQAPQGAASPQAGWQAPQGVASPQTGWQASQGASPQAGWQAPQGASPQAGWQAPQGAASPQAGWQAPPGAASPQAGWQAPQAGTSPPSAGWQAPQVAAHNPVAAWQREETGKGVFAYFYGVPACMEGPTRLLYILLTVAALPIIVPATVYFFMLRARIRRRGVTSWIAVVSQTLTAGGYFVLFMGVGEWLQINGHLFATPTTLLLVAPVFGRLALKRLAR